MSSEIRNKSTIITSVFSKEELDFIDRSESEMRKLQNKLISNKNKLNCILNYMSILNARKENCSPDMVVFFSKMLSDANENLDLLNMNVSNLVSLGKSLQNLNEVLMNFMVSLQNDTGDYDINNYTEISNTITEKIKDYLNCYSQKKASLVYNEKKADEFIQSLQYYGLDIDKLCNAKVFKTTAQSDTLLDNKILLISEKQNKVLLPYLASEIKNIFEQNKDVYKNYDEVISEKFVVPFENYSRHPFLSRFKEAYSLMHTKEKKSIFASISFSFEMMNKRSLHPAVITACSSEKQLNNYLHCLKNNELDKFSDFDVKFEMNPISTGESKYDISQVTL